MKIFNSYVSKKYLLLFLIITFGTLFLISIVDYIANFSKFSHLKFYNIFFFYFFKSVGMLTFLLPITTFFATCLISKRISENNEIMAYMSLGGSLYDCVKMFFLFSIFAAKIVLLLEFFIIPLSKKEKEDFEEKYNINDFFKKTRDTNVFLKVKGDKVISIGYYNASTDSGENIIIDEIRNNKLVSRITAKKIEWDEAEEVWVLFDWIKRVYGKDKNSLSQGHEFVFEELQLKPDELWIKLRIKIKVTMPVLTKYISRMKEYGSAYTDEFKIEQAKRIKNIFLIIIVIFLGLFLFIKNNNRIKKTGYIRKLIILSIIFLTAFIPDNIILLFNTNVFIIVLSPLLIDFLLLFYLYKKIKF